MIRLDHLRLTFPDGAERLVAVDDASLTVEPGTVVGVTGPSGSGKSSLLAMAALLIRPDSGLVEIGGVDTSSLSAADASALRREEIGIVFQQSNLLPSLTAREQLVMMGELDGSARRGRRERAARADELLDAVGLSSFADRRPAELSGGQRQRVNIARALMNDPSALLVDEPTSALDQERGKAIIDLVLRLAEERSVATILVTHDLTHLPRLHATRWMVDGHLGTEPVLVA